MTTQTPTAPLTTEDIALKPSDIIKARGHNPSSLTYMDNESGSVCLVAAIAISQTEGLQTEEDFSEFWDTQYFSDERGPEWDKIDAMAGMVAEKIKGERQNRMQNFMVCYDFNSEKSEEEVIELLESVGL